MAIDGKSIKSTLVGGNDYIITIKKNQPSLYQAAEELDISTVAIDSWKSSEKLHGRKTTRHTKIYPMPPELLPWWPGAKQIIAIARSGTRTEGKKNRSRLVDFDESHYYLSSKEWSAHQFAEGVQGHWFIENRLHWVKDVTLNEDNCVHRGGNAAANWAMVRQFLVSIARMFCTKTLPQALRFMANQIEKVSELLFGFCTDGKPVKSGSIALANSPIP